MNLLKKAFVFLLAAVLCLSLTACGGSDSGGGGDFIDSGKQADKYFHVSHNKNRRRKVK